MMGYDPKVIPTPYQKTLLPEAEKRIAALARMRDEALAHHELAARIMAKRITRGFTLFETGEKVWLENTNLRINYQSRKLAPKREGPFVIEEKLSPLVYKLKLPKTWKIHPVFHAHLLSRYKENEIHGENFLNSPPELEEEGDLFFEAEAILQHKKERGHLKFLVKWKDSPLSENSWEALGNLRKAPDLIKSYNRVHKLGLKL